MEARMVDDIVQMRGSTVPPIVRSAFDVGEAVQCEGTGYWCIARLPRLLGSWIDMTPSKHFPPAGLSVYIAVDHEYGSLKRAVRPGYVPNSTTYPTFAVR